jgi:hypothetical protein
MNIFLATLLYSQLIFGADKKALKKPENLNIDLSDLEGTWSTEFYYNHDVGGKIKTCKVQSSQTWVFNGQAWSQYYNQSTPDKDIVFNSNGKFQIKEIIKQSDINYIKADILVNKINLTEICWAYMRDGNKLWSMVNYADGILCPTKFMYFNDACTDQFDFAISTCVSGKCIDKPTREYDAKSSSAFNLVTSKVSLVALGTLIAYSFI